MEYFKFIISSLGDSVIRNWQYKSPTGDSDNLEIKQHTRGFRNHFVFWIKESSKDCLSSNLSSDLNSTEIHWSLISHIILYT